jgi:hypothetical protein
MKSDGRFDNRAELFDWQSPAVIRQRVNDDHRVFARFDHFIEIADRAVANGGSQWTVVPDRLFAFQQKTADEIC